jgi:hypothetical protein
MNEALIDTTPVATPVAAIVAVLSVHDIQVTWLVMSWVV